MQKKNKSLPLFMLACRVLGVDINDVLSRKRKFAPDRRLACWLVCESSAPHRHRIPPRTLAAALETRPDVISQRVTALAFFPGPDDWRVRHLVSLWTTAKRTGVCSPIHPTIKDEAYRLLRAHALLSFNSTRTIP